MKSHWSICAFVVLFFAIGCQGAGGIEFVPSTPQGSTTDAGSAGAAATDPGLQPAGSAGHAGGARDDAGTGGTPAVNPPAGGSGDDAGSPPPVGGQGGSSAAGSAPIDIDAGGTDAAVASGVAPVVSDIIESVGFDSHLDTTISTAPIPTPVLLYQGGLASLNTQLVVAPIDISFDLVEHPDAWPAWRRTAAGVELQTSSGWTPLHYSYECAPLAKGATFVGTFEHRRDVVIGSTAAVTTIFRFRFKDDGTFETCKSTLTAVPAIPTIERKTEPKTGTYEIDGYKLHLTYNEGGEDLYPLFFDPARPGRLWLGTNYYPTPTNDIPEICRVP